jgi:hypothetical protein
MEAEDFNDQSGVQTEACGEGGNNIGYIEDGDYVVYKNISFGSGASSFQARVASAAGGGDIEIRLDSIRTFGRNLSCYRSGDWQTYVNATCNIAVQAILMIYI